MEPSPSVTKMLVSGILLSTFDIKAIHKLLKLVISLWKIANNADYGLLSPQVGGRPALGALEGLSFKDVYRKV